MANTTNTVGPEAPAAAILGQGEPASKVEAGSYAGLKRRGMGAACAPPPSLPPGYSRATLMQGPPRPSAWMCRDCCAWSGFNYIHPGDPDVACAECERVLSPDERRLEVDRLLARMVPSRTVPAAPLLNEEANPRGSGPTCTIDEAMGILACKRTTIFKLLGTGRLVSAPKVGKHTMLVRESVVTLALSKSKVSVPKKNGSKKPVLPKRSGERLAAEIENLPIH